MLTIFEAAKKGDIEALKHWVEVEKRDINQRDKFGMTPWLLAVQYADVVTLRWLVAHGADVSAKNGKFTVLYYLVLAHEGKAAERPAKLAYLQELGIEFAHPSFALICSDEWEKLKTISHENANYLKQTDHWGCRLLHYAAAWGNQAAVEWLLQAGEASITEKNNNGWTALLLAAEGGHLKVVQWLLQAGGASITEKNNNGWTALLLAAANGHLEIVQWLLQAGGASITENNNSWTALLFAAEYGHLNVVQWLLETGGASIGEKDINGRTALLLAVEYGHLDVVQWLLLEGGTSITENNNGWTPFLLAAAHGRIEIVQWLLQAGGASIGDKDEYGHTALLLAAANGHLEMVQWLLQAGDASIAEKNKEGMTALLFAAECGHLKIVQWLLLAGGASIDEKDEGGLTALLLAAANGHLEMVQWLLLAGGASITEKDKKGWTALLLGARYGHLEVVRWLLQAGGASIAEKTNDDKTALYLAFLVEHYDIVLFLLDHQADISDALVLASSLDIPVGDSTSKKLQATLQFAEALLKQKFAPALACIKEAAVSVNFTLGEGNTPLHILARETAGNTYRNELLSLLIKKGAHRYLLNAKAQTPIDIAKAQGDRELQGLLQTEFEKFYEHNIVISQALMAKVLNGYLPTHGIPVVDMTSRNYFLAAEFWPLILVEEVHTLLGYCQMDIAICSPVQQKKLEKLLVDFDEKVAAEEGSQVADYFLTEVEESELVKLIKSLQALNNLILKTHLQSDHALKTMSDEIWIRDSLITSYQLQPLEENSAGNENATISNKLLIDKWQTSFLAAPTALPLDLKEKEPASEAKISSEDVNRDDDYLSFGCHLL